MGEKAFGSKATSPQLTIFIHECHGSEYVFNGCQEMKGRTLGKETAVRGDGSSMFAATSNGRPPGIPSGIPIAPAVAASGNASSSQSLDPSDRFNLTR
nr:hypothetical protein Iba_chr02cCG2000 [Ipomoea batatas]